MGAKNYTLDERILLNEKLQPYLEPYYENDGKKLSKLVDEILIRLKYYDVEKDEFVSLADEIIVNAMYDYDFKQDFNGYIYRCLENKFKTEMTRRNRYKRQADRMALSLEEKVGNSEDGITVGDILADKKTIEGEFFEERQDTYSEKMSNYLGRLSYLQKEVLRLISIGFMPSEILEELHINQKMYEDCYNAIHSYRNTSILM